MKDEKFTVGQTLWFVPSDLRWNQPYEVKIEIVGRKWMTLSNSRRIDIDTMRCEGFGMCYLSKEAYEEDIALGEAWQKFKRRVDLTWNAPKGATIEAIRQAEKLLFPE